MAVAWYGLDGRAVTAADAARLLADWPRRMVAEDVIPSGPTVILVVTFFTVIPQAEPGYAGYGYAGHPYAETAPVLWETVVTVEEAGALVGRYRSRADAEVGHVRVVAHVHRLLQSGHPGQALDALTRMQAPR